MPRPRPGDHDPPLPRSTDYLSLWSFYALLVGGLVAWCARATGAGRTIAVAVLANAFAVSAFGPAVLAFARVPGPCGALHKGNFLFHAIPSVAVVAALLFARRGGARRASVGAAVGGLLALDAAWLATPIHGQGNASAGLGKLRPLYGLGPRAAPAWAAGFVALQVAGVVLGARFLKGGRA